MWSMAEWVNRYLQLFLQHILYYQTTVEGMPVVDPMAIQLCARKVAAVAGDVRKALDVCRRAVEIVQADVRMQTVLKPKPGKKYFMNELIFIMEGWGEQMLGHL